ncbi:hypothetical protein ACFWBH_30265 [Streptomyces sp. NPDC059999]|uniref:hypothetical protein n=1 Tax=Streptomyces sp. NPDC059999 TaxID=3347030 RepID=UPI003678A712
MSDIHELLIVVDLRDEISETELAELSWHVGTGPQPGRLSIVTEFPIVIVDDSGSPMIEDGPHPLLAGQGAASRVGGAIRVGFLRFHEAQAPDVLQVKAGHVNWPT